MAGNYQPSGHPHSKFLDDIPLTESVGSVVSDASIPRRIWTAANVSSHILNPQPTSSLFEYIDEEAEARFRVTSRRVLNEELAHFKERQIKESQTAGTAKLVEAIVQHINVSEDFSDLQYSDSLVQLSASLPPYEAIQLDEQMFAQCKLFLTQLELAGKQT